MAFLFTFSFCCFSSLFPLSPSLALTKYFFSQLLQNRSNNHFPKSGSDDFRRKFKAFQRKIEKDKERYGRFGIDEKPNAKYHKDTALNERNRREKGSHGTFRFLSRLGVREKRRAAKKTTTKKPKNAKKKAKKKNAKKTKKGKRKSKSSKNGYKGKNNASSNFKTKGKSSAKSNQNAKNNSKKKASNSKAKDDSMKEKKHGKANGKSKKDSKSKKNSKKMTTTQAPLPTMMVLHVPGERGYNRKRGYK